MTFLSLASPSSCLSANIFVRITTADKNIRNQAYVSIRQHPSAVVILQASLHARVLGALQTYYYEALKHTTMRP